MDLTQSGDLLQGLQHRLRGPQPVWGRGGLGGLLVFHFDPDDGRFPKPEDIFIGGVVTKVEGQVAAEPAPQTLHGVTFGERAGRQELHHLAAEHDPEIGLAGQVRELLPHRLGPLRGGPKVHGQRVRFGFEAGAGPLLHLTLKVRCHFPQLAAHLGRRGGRSGSGVVHAAAGFHPVSADIPAPAHRAARAQVA